MILNKIQKKVIAANKSKMLKIKNKNSKKKYELSIRNFYIWKANKNWGSPKVAKPVNQGPISVSKLAKMSNPWNLLPDCSAIRGKLQKLELSRKSINKYLDSNEDNSDFNCSQFVFNKNMKKISSRNVISPILDQFTTVTSVPTEPKRFDFYFKEFQSQYDSKENVAENNGFWSPTCDIKETQSDPFCNDEIQNYLKYVSRFEWSCWQWLVLKENFQTHLSFCQNKFKKQEGSFLYH